VMMADWIGNRDNMIHDFLRAIAPSIRETVEPNGHAVEELAKSLAKAN